MTLLEAFWNLRLVAENAGAPDFDFETRLLKGTVRIDHEVVNCLGALEAAGDLPLLTCDGKRTATNMLPGQGEVEFEASAPKSYFETLGELIRRHPISPPDDYKVFDIRDDDGPLGYYRHAVFLGRLLSSISMSTAHKEWLLWATDRLVIPMTYAESDLCPIDEAEDLARKLEDDSSLDSNGQRTLDVYRSIFTQAINDVVVGVPRDQRFGYLMRHFDECVCRFRLGFRAFADEANGAIRRYEESRSGMISSLNGVLGNIQTALIGVPLAGVLALREMGVADGLCFENAIICVAVLTVGGLLLILSFSQGKTLAAVEDQHQRLKDEVKGCGCENTDVGRMLESAKKHHSLVSKLLIAVRVIIIVFMLTAIVALLHRSGWKLSGDESDKAQESSLPELDGLFRCREASTATSGWRPRALACAFYLAGGRCCRFVEFRATGWCQAGSVPRDTPMTQSGLISWRAVVYESIGLGFKVSFAATDHFKQ